MDVGMFFIWVVLSLFTIRESNKFWRDKHQILLPWLDYFWGLVGGIAGGSVFRQFLPPRGPDYSDLLYPRLTNPVDIILFRVVPSLHNSISASLSILGSFIGALLLYSLGLWLSSKKNSKNHIFSIKWIVASLVSTVIAICIAQAIEGEKNSISLLLFPFSGFLAENIRLNLIIGLLLGIAQWSVLQTRISVAGKKYILVSTLSYIFAFYYSRHIGFFFSIFSFGLLSDNVASGFSVGIFVGFAQWILLRTFLIQARWVFFANILGWVLVGFLMPYTFQSEMHYSIYAGPLSSLIVAILIAGLTVGVSSVVTGSTLVWLFYKNNCKIL